MGVKSLVNLTLIQGNLVVCLVDGKSLVECIMVHTGSKTVPGSKNTFSVTFWARIYNGF